MNVLFHTLTRPASARTAQPAKRLSGGKALAKIQQDIIHTRDKLADTVEPLVHKVDLPARAEDKVQGTKKALQAKLGQVSQRLYKRTETLQGKIKESVPQANTLTNQARAKLPPPLTGGITHLTKAARQRPVPAAAVVLCVFLALRLLRRNR